MAIKNVRDYGAGTQPQTDTAIINAVIRPSRIVANNASEPSGHRRAAGFCGTSTSWLKESQQALGSRCWTFRKRTGNVFRPADSEKIPVPFLL